MPVKRPTEVKTRGSKLYRSVPFYEKNGFRRMNAEDEDPHTRLMYYDLMDIAG